MTPPNGYVNTSGAAKVLGCTYRTVQNMMKRKQIPYYKMGRRVLLKPEELLRSIGKYAVSESPTPDGSPVGGALDDHRSWCAALKHLEHIRWSSKDPKHAELARAVIRFIQKFDTETTTTTKGQ